MTACVAFPFEIPAERQRGRTVLAQVCVIKVESILPVLAFNHNNVCKNESGCAVSLLKIVPSEAPIGPDINFGLKKGWNKAAVPVIK